MRHAWAQPAATSNTSMHRGAQLLLRRLAPAGGARTLAERTAVAAQESYDTGAGGSSFPPPPPQLPQQPQQYYPPQQPQQPPAVGYGYGEQQQQAPQQQPPGAFPAYQPPPPQQQPPPPAYGSPAPLQDGQYAAVGSQEEEQAGGEYDQSADYDPDCINMVALSGVVSRAPRLMTFSSGKSVANLAIRLFPNGPVRPWEIDVDAWDEIGQELSQQVALGDALVVNGHLSVDKRQAAQGAKVLKVVLDSWWRLNQPTIPPEAMEQVHARSSGMMGGPQGSGGPGPQQQGYGGSFGASPATRQAVWQAFVAEQLDLGQAAARAGVQGQAAFEALLEQALEAPMGPDDWRRLCFDLRLVTGHITAGELSEAVARAAAANPGAVSQRGEPLRKPIRDWLLADPGLGPRVRAQEAETGGSPTITYMQLRAVLQMMRMGVPPPVA